MYPTLKGRLDANGASDELPQLLAAAGAGDERAWRSVIELYSRRVYALAKSRCGRHDTAEEVTQSVFVTVASKLGREGYSESGKFEPWLFRVAMNRIRDEMRRQKRHAEPHDPATFGSVRAPREESTTDGAGIRDDETFASLRSAMTQLSEADREIVELRHHAGLSFKQIAELLEEPLGTLLARHHRALRKLKELIEPSGISGSGTGPARPARSSI